MAVEKRIVVGASGASGMPLLIKCLKILRTKEEYRSLLVMSRETDAGAGDGLERFAGGNSGG